MVKLDGPFTHQLVHTHGVRLHVARAGNPRAPLVLLLHGSYSGWFDYRKVIAPLAERGYDVAAADTRGFGMSDRPPTPFGYEMASAVGDLVGLITSLGHSKATLVGADTGGSVAWCTAATHPDLTRGLVSIAASHPRDMRRAMLRRPWQHLSAITRTVGVRSPLAPMREALTDLDAFYRHQLLSSTGRAFHASLDFEETIALWLKARRVGSSRSPIRYNHRLLASGEPDSPVRAPVLFFHADTPGWRNLARLSARRAAALTARHIPGTAGQPHLENPTAFVDEVAGFLEGLPR